MSKIEWCDRTLNPIRGLCPHECPYCYMTKIHKRFGTGQETTYHWQECIRALYRARKPTTFFIGSANDLFVHPSYVRDVKLMIDHAPISHTHKLLFLTKNPKAYEGLTPFSNNKNGSFLGASLDGKHWTDFNGGHDLLDFISVEPLLAPVKLPETSARAVIIGGLTGHGSPYKHTLIEWVDDVVKQALDSGMKVFIKDNLKDYIPPLEAKYGVSLRQLLWKVRG